MNLAGTPFAESTFAGSGFAGVVVAVPEDPPVFLVDAPFVVEIAGTMFKPIAGSVSIDVELGRQGVASFEVVNLNVSPQIGQEIRILYYTTIIFAGGIDRIRLRSDQSESYIRYSLECTDYSYLLHRRRLKATYVNLPATSIAYYLAQSELSGDGITIGVADASPNIPLAEADGISIYEFINQICTSVGMVFWVDFEKRMNLVSSTVQVSPHVLNAEFIEECSVVDDRETYRNVQTTEVTGTPLVEQQEPITISVTQVNNEQLSHRAAVEGNKGEYDSIDSVVHPTSNDPIQLTKLAVAHNHIKLGVTGSIRREISIRTRLTGFHVGQFVNVDLPYLGISGQWSIQKVSLQDEAGLFLVTTLSLSQSTLLRRAQQLWLEVVAKGTVTILPPSAVFQNKNIYSSPGSFQFVVPSGITQVQVTCFGGGGGGGGGAKSNWPGYGGVVVADGASGGGGGLVITVFNVTPGETLTLVVGAGGSGGSLDSKFQSFTNALAGIGLNGSLSSVSRAGNFEVCLAYGGSGGIGGLANARFQQTISWPQGTGGGGLFGQVITTGGAGNGGTGGLGSVPSHGQPGGTGKVWVEW